eukprot:gene12328-14560_t
MCCPECNEADYLFEGVQAMLVVVKGITGVSEEDANRLAYVMEEVESHFHRYVGHRLRTIHQNSVPGLEIQEMGYTECFAIIDYMNKWLPHKSFATTSDAFGQTGESVHGVTIYTRALPESVKAEIGSGEIEDIQGYLGSLDQVHAMNMLEGTLAVLYEVEPHLVKMRLRFDNAPGYHGTLFWVFMPKLKSATGVGSNIRSALGDFIKVADLEKLCKSPSPATSGVEVLRCGEMPPEIGNQPIVRPGKRALDAISEKRAAKAQKRATKEAQVNAGHEANALAEYVDFLEQSQEIDLEYLKRGLEFKDSVAGSAFRECTIVRARERCALWKMGFATKTKVVAQKKTPEQVAMLEKFYQDGLLLGPGRSCRAADKDVLAEVNAASAFDKQIRLEQITSWFSQRHSKQVVATQQRNLNQTVAAVVATHVASTAEPGGGDESAFDENQKLLRQILERLKYVEAYVKSTGGHSAVTQA